MVLPLIALAVCFGGLAGPLVVWDMLSDDTSAQPTWRTQVPCDVIALTGILWLTTSSPVALAAWVAATVLALWVSAQFLIACWAPATVYVLRYGNTTGNRAGRIAYIGSTRRPWHERMAEHQDDRNPGWADWKRDVDWAISGPAWRRLTEAGARRLERRTIRTMVYAARIGIAPPIENETDTKLRSPAHPILAARLVWLRAQGFLFRTRALRLPVPKRVDVETPAPLGIDALTHDVDPDTIVEAAEVAASTRTSRPASASGRPPTTHADPATPDLDSDPDLSADPSDASEPSHDEPDSVPPVPSHDDGESSHDPLPPVGGEPDGTDETRDGAWDDETGDGETGRAVEGVEDTGLGDEAEAWLKRHASAPGRPSAPEGRPKSAGRGTSGGRAAEMPPWVPKARAWRAAGLSIGKVREAIIAEGLGEPSRSTVDRWTKGAGDA